MTSGATAGRRLAALLLVAVAPNADGQPAGARPASAPAQWGQLTPGRYGVGFRLAGEYDHSRRVAPPTDFEGKPNAGPLSMPLQIGVWYPTARTSARAMPFGIFAALGAKRNELTPVTEADRARAIENRKAFAGFAFGMQLTDSAVRIADTTATAAVRDAPPSRGRFPVLLVATDGSIAAATVLFEYLASHGIVVIATPSQMSYATLQLSRPGVVIEARVRDLELLLAHSRRYDFADTSRVAVLGVNFDGMAALAFQMKNMAARAVVSLDGWEGKRGSLATLRSSLHFDARRMRVPYLVVLQDEPSPPPNLALDRGVFDTFHYSDRQWLVLKQMTHAYLIGNPLSYAEVPEERRRGYELLVRSIHRVLDASLAESARPLATLATAEAGGDGRSALVKDIVHVEARPAVPDAEELERLIMVDRAADKVATILREGRRLDSTFVLFPQTTMALYAFRFSRQNNLALAIRLLELNVEAYPQSWTAADALGNGYRDANESIRAIAAYERALSLLVTASSAPAAPPDVARSRQAIEEKIARLKQR
jgi:hypothetical protein